MDLTLGTFNLNNLFDRFNFQADLDTLPAIDLTAHTTLEWAVAGRGGPGAANTEPAEIGPPPAPVVRIQRNANGTLLRAKSFDAQKAVASRIEAIDVDVLAVQEVENLDALRLFNRECLGRQYPYEVLIEGNDPRFIDVGLLSRYPVANVTTHRFEEHPDSAGRVFSRDLLEVDVLNSTRRRRLLKVFVNHLKSKFVPFGAANPTTAQVANDLRRTRQAETVARVVGSRTRPDTRFAVVGDFNDSPESAPLAPMVQSLQLVDALADVVESQPPPRATNPEDQPTDVRWTSRYSISRGPDSFELLDQIWLSQRLARHLSHAEIERRPRWTATSAGVGSDHDPVWVRLSGL